MSTVRTSSYHVHHLSPYSVSNQLISAKHEFEDLNNNSEAANSDLIDKPSVEQHEAVIREALEEALDVDNKSNIWMK